jgi:hypothetical protein
MLLLYSIGWGTGFTEGEEELRSSFPKVNSRKSSYVKPDVSNMEASEAKVVLV